MTENSVYIELEPKVQHEHVVGQLFWVPAPMVSPDPLTLRIGSWKAGMDVSQAELTVEKTPVADLGRTAIGHKGDIFRRMPIPELKLDSSQELLVQKIKMRPCVLVMRDCVDTKRFANVHAGVKGGQVSPKQHVFAPVFSLRHQETPSQNYPEKFIDDLRDRNFPHLLFMPAFGREIVNDSMLVMNDLFAVGLHSFKETNLCLQPLHFAAFLEGFWQFIEGDMLTLAEKLQASG